MDEVKPRHAPIIPAISFRLPKLMIGDEFLGKVPTYISQVISEGAMPSIEGKLNGQPFHAAWPPAFYHGHPEHPIYLQLDLPQQSVIFYERTRGTEGPSYAINYTNREPEERSDERKKSVMVHLHVHAPKGRYVFDTDSEIDRQHLEKLRAISDYLKPTLRFWKKIGRVNAVKLLNSHGKGTLDSLVVPETG